MAVPNGKDRVKNHASKRYDYIDAIRGFAILGVVLVHTRGLVLPQSSIISAIAVEGARGVQLFYIASALTLFMSMKSRMNKENKPILNFYIRRFFRIAPLFYLAIIIYTSYDGMSARYWAPNGLQWWYIPLTALFANGWHPETITSVIPGGWSIAVEMTFYIIVPYLFFVLKDIKKTSLALLLALVVSKIASFGVTYLVTPLYPDPQKYLVDMFTFLWFFSQLPVFILGILLFHIINKYPKGEKSTAILLLVSSFYLFAALLTVSTYRNMLPKHFLFGVAFLVFSLALYYLPNIFLINKVTIWIGRLSFSIYLVHFMVLNILKKIFSNGFWLDGNYGYGVACLLVLSISICISYVTYRVIELPGINLGKQIIESI